MIFAINGKTPNIHPTAFVAPNAVIIGDVTLEANSSVWFGCVLRGDSGAIVIGEGSNVQDGAVMHENTILGKDITVGHMALVHNARIADNVLIGLCSAVYGGSEVGERSVIAAGAVCVPGTRIPPNSMAMGIPAKVVREATERDREMTRRLTGGYQQNRGRYLEGLEPVDETAKALMLRLRAGM
ncbi:MAG: gamma carbonic anhydrase family protein [Chloroflexi bacterium]|nr:gamma carbonic anhydrase family protein [Chloroflexota bacterium]